MVESNHTEGQKAMETQLEFYKFAAHHEAAHALAAYHLWFPYLGVHFKISEDGQLTQSHLRVDMQSLRAGLWFLTNDSSAEEQALIAMCAVLMAAAHINSAIDNIAIEEAMKHAARDYNDMHAFLESAGLDEPRKQSILKKSLYIISRIINDEKFNDCIHAISWALSEYGQLNPQSIEIIMNTVGAQRLVQIDTTLPEEAIRSTAYYLSTVPEGRRDDQFYNWVTAETGIKFAMACISGRNQFYKSFSSFFPI